jgi:glucose dehydrogenase
MRHGHDEITGKSKHSLFKTPTHAAVPHHSRASVPTTLSGDSAWGLTPWDQGECRKLIERYRNDGIFTPSSMGEPSNTQA